MTKSLCLLGAVARVVFAGVLGCGGGSDWLCVLRGRPRRALWCVALNRAERSDVAIKTIMVLIASALAACVGPPPDLATVDQAATSDPCAVPAAVPDDGLDDRVAIQNALTTKGCAHLGAGTYDIDTPVAVAPARRVYAMLTMTTGRTVYGGGPDTVLSFRGDAGGQDWFGLGLNGDRARVHDLTIDTSELTNTSEQTHAIHGIGPTTGLEVDHVAFEHPARDLPGGDCIQFVGYGPTPIVGARVHHNTFAHCDRSGVAAHSGMHDLQVVDNEFADTGDQDFDGEGSGGNDGILIARNHFALSPQAQGTMAIQIQLAVNVRITDNQFGGRGLFLYGCSACELDHNTLSRTASGNSAIVEISEASSGVNVHHNTMDRAAGAGAGPMVRLVPHNSGTPDHVTVADNQILQHASGDIVNSTGAVGLYVYRNSVTYSGPVGASWGVLANGSAGATPIRTDDIHVDRNTWYGALSGIIGVSGSYGGCRSVESSDNVATASLNGLVCLNVSTGAQVLGPVTSVRNQWPAHSCGPAGFVQTSK